MLQCEELLILGIVEKMLTIAKIRMTNVTMLPAGIDIAAMRGALQLELSWAMKASPGFTYQWTIRNVSISGIF